MDLRPRPFPHKPLPKANTTRTLVNIIPPTRREEKMPDLSNPIPDQEAVADLPVGASPTMTTPRDEQARIPWRKHLTPAIVGLVVVLVTIANQLVIPSLNRLLEANVCRDYYEKHDPSVIGPGGDIDESLCKGKSIQTKVAELIGLITTLGVACGL